MAPSSATAGDGRSSPAKACWGWLSRVWPRVRVGVLSGEMREQRACESLEVGQAGPPHRLTQRAKSPEPGDRVCARASPTRPSHLPGAWRPAPSSLSHGVSCDPQTCIHEWGRGLVGVGRHRACEHCPSPAWQAVPGSVPGRAQPPWTPLGAGHADEWRQAQPARPWPLALPRLQRWGMGLEGWGPPGKMPRTRVAGAPRCGASEQGEAPGWQLYPASDS